jgi:hypothetical protein
MCNLPKNFAASIDECISQCRQKVSFRPTIIILHVASFAAMLVVRIICAAGEMEKEEMVKITHERYQHFEVTFTTTVQHLFSE